MRITAKEWAKLGNPPEMPRVRRSPKKVKVSVELEKTIQTAIIAFLRTIRRSYWVRYNGGAMKKGNAFIRFTSQRGHPDIGGTIDGYTVMIEVKRPGEVPTPAQKMAHADWRRGGAVVIVADGIDAIRSELLKEGLWP